MGFKSASKGLTLLVGTVWSLQGFDCVVGAGGSMWKGKYFDVRLLKGSAGTVLYSFRAKSVCPFAEGVSRHRTV